MIGKLNIFGPFVLGLVFAPLFMQEVNAFVLEGSQSSYAQFRKWQSTANTSLSFDFLTDQPNGGLLYTDDGGFYDFFELKLVDGSVRMRFNLGKGAHL